MATANSNRYLFVVTQYDREPDLAAAPLVVANNALASGADVLLWLTHDGVELAKQGQAERVNPQSFPNLGELLGQYLQGGGKVGVCPPCAKTHGVTDENLRTPANWMGAQALVAEMQGRQALSF